LVIDIIHYQGGVSVGTATAPAATRHPTARAAAATRAAARPTTSRSSTIAWTAPVTGPHAKGGPTTARAVR